MKTPNYKQLEKAHKQIRAERLDFLEGLDYIIGNLAMSDEKREKLTTRASFSLFFFIPNHERGNHEKQ